MKEHNAWQAASFGKHVCLVVDNCYFRSLLENRRFIYKVFPMASQFTKDYPILV